jgi:glycosyltransferase involved in cell wall biosynthesis
MLNFKKQQPLPLVTVYLVNHNYGRYITQAIESVLNQTMNDYELIIIDDGSTDHSHEVIHKYSTSNDNIITIFQHNKGLNVTNNIALRKARGQYIIRLDADDWLDVHALQLLSGVLENNSDIGMVFPDYYYVDSSGKLMETVRRHNFDEVSLLDQPAHGACTMIRTRCLKEIGGYDEEFRRQDGYELWIRFIQHYKVKNVNLPLFYYRQHSLSLTKNENQILKTRAKILEKHAKNNSKSGIKNAVAIIPIRGSSTDAGSQALRALGNKLLMNWTIDAALESERISDIIVTTPDLDVMSYVKSTYGNQVILVEREAEMSQVNSLLQDTIQHSLKEYSLVRGQFPDAISLLFIEFPFRNSRYIDNSIDVLDLFDIDTVVGVKIETDSFYMHNGKGLQLVKKGINLNLESEDIFRKTGGIQSVRTKYYNSSKKYMGGRTGHIVIGEEASFSVSTDWQWSIAELLCNNLHK